MNFFKSMWALVCFIFGIALIGAIILNLIGFII